MDHGKLTDNNGKSVDFRNVILIMTSNLGAEEMERANLGFTQMEKTADDDAVKNFFAPEFRNRLDATVVFKKLAKEVLMKIVGKFMVDLKVMLKEKNVAIELTNEAIDYLVEHGYDDKMGARPMYRIIQDKIKKPLAEELIFGELSKNGGSVIVTVEDDELKIDLKSSPRKEEKKKEKV